MQELRRKYQIRSNPLMVSLDQRMRVFRLGQEYMPLEYIRNEYEDNRNGTVTDHATGLMWQKSHSEQMNYKKAAGYVKRLNHQKFAGYTDWRLPTVDELVSLLENKRMSGNLYIDPVFDSKDGCYWSSDEGFGIEREPIVWYVCFCESHAVFYNYKWSRPYCVRCVRSGR